MVNKYQVKVQDTFKCQFLQKKLGYIYATFIGKKNILLNECYYSN